MDALAEIIIVGVIAIVVLDLWQLALKFLFGVPSGNWAHVGRWVSHFTRGRLYHRAIGEAEPFRYEAATTPPMIISAELGPVDQTMKVSSSIIRLAPRSPRRAS